MQETPTEHVYKVPLGRRLPWMIMIPLMAVGLICVVVTMTPFVVMAVSEGDMRSVLVIVVPFVAFAGGTMFLLGPMGIAFFTTATLTVTPEGLDYDLAPAIRHQCVWMDASHIENLHGFDTLFLNQSKTTGNPFWVWYYRIAVPQKMYSVSLSVFDEWPFGGLANDLRRYAPQLFEQRPG
jgi:hypothetical protein